MKNYFFSCKKDHLLKHQRNKLILAYKDLINHTVFLLIMIKICHTWLIFISGHLHRRSEASLIQVPRIHGSLISKQSQRVLSMHMMIRSQILRNHLLKLQKSHSVQVSSLVISTQMISKLAKVTTQSRLRNKSSATLNNNKASSTVNSKPSSV